MPNPGPYDIKSTFVVTGADLLATPVTVTDTFWTDLDQQFPDFSGKNLISCFSFDEDWPTWEIHPKGDEFGVCCPAMSR